MKLFGYSITRSKPSTINHQPSTKSLSPEALAWLSGNASCERHPSTLLASPFEQVSWVYRAVTAVAEHVANIPFLFSRERGRESLITSGPLLDFYDQPHRHINRFQYWELRVLWLLLRGECFRIPIYDDSFSASASSSSSFSDPASSIKHPASSLSAFRAPHSALKSVLILNPSHFHEIIQNHELVGWRYTGGSIKSPLESQVFLPEEVWFDKLPNPFNFWRGLSPLSAANLAASTDYAASNFMRGFIDNNADSGLIVRTTDALDDTQRAQLIAALNNRKRSAGVADRPLLLWNSCEIVKPTISAADLQFLENRKFSRAEICSVFGVPEEIVSTSDHNKYDVMQGARLNFIENRIAPLCARLEASERPTVRALDPNAVGWFDLESLPPMQQARRDRLATAKIGFDMGIPFNELNRVLDLGFPPLPHGNTCYLPSALQTAGRLPLEKVATIRIPSLPLTACPEPQPDRNAELLKMFRQLHAIITS